MKIIKRGQIPEEKVVRFTCRNCDSVMEATRNEYTVHNHRNETILSILCPVCTADVYADAQPTPRSYF